MLRSLARQALLDVDVMVLLPEPMAPYSGMVPGWLTGLFRFDEIVIDFPALVSAAGARWVQGEIHALDPARRQISLTDGTTLDYDLLALNVGSMLNPPQAEHGQVLSLRPLSMLRQHGPLLDRWRDDGKDRPFVVVAVGGGAAGFEALLAVLQRLRRLRSDRVVHGGLLTRGSVQLPGLAPAARRAAQRALARAGVTVQFGSGWCGSVERSSNVVLLATGAVAHG